MWNLDSWVEVCAPRRLWASPRCRPLPRAVATTISAAIDVAIGLMLMYLVLSLACTVINEFIATLLKKRVEALREALTNIIDVAALKNDFYNHGLISAPCAAAKGTHFFVCFGSRLRSGHSRKPRSNEAVASYRRLREFDPKSAR